MSKFISGLSSYVGSKLASQMPMVVEHALPQLEIALREHVQRLSRDPEDGPKFAANWARLNDIVMKELGPPAPPPSKSIFAAFGAAKKRTRKTIKRRRNQRANV